VIAQSTTGRHVTVTVATIDERADPALARKCGVDAAAILKLRNEYPFTVQFLESFGSVREPAERLATTLRDYQPLLKPEDLVLHTAVTVASDPGGIKAPRTGIPLYRLVAASGPVPVALSSEDEIAEADWPFLAAAAADATVAFGQGTVTVRSARGVRLALAARRNARPLLDGEPWNAAGDGTVLVPPGDHTVAFSPGSAADEPAIVDASCDILEARAVTRGLRFAYESTGRASVVLDRQPLGVEVDGAAAATVLPAGPRGTPSCCRPASTSSPS